LVSRGVYFLTNNKMYDFTIAFLNSFRKYNPVVPLCVIPYNNDFDKIAALKDSYRFTVFPDMALLNACDKLSLQLHEKVTSEYRKLAMWEGVFDEFIYIDIDTVVLDDVSFAFEYLHDHWFVAGTSNLPGSRQYVWFDGVEHTNLLNADQIAYSANTGFMVSKRGFINMDYIEQKMPTAKLLEDYMQFKCLEQPFLNYLVVTSGKQYTSLTLLAKKEKKRKVMTEYWGGGTNGKIKNGKIYVDTGKPVLFIHWAGVWRLKEQMPNKKIWDYYRKMELPANGLNGHKKPKQPFKFLFSFLQQLKSANGK
jgi:hypothetical protein